MRYLFLLLPIAACQSNPPATTAPPAARVDVPPPIDSPDAFILPTGPLRSADTDQPTDHDTLHTGVGVLYLRPSTAAAFAQAPAALDWKSDQRLPTSGRVRRVGPSLLLQPDQGPVVTFTSRLPTEQSSSADIARQATVRYLGALAPARVWVVLTDSAAKTVTTLVDQRTGRCTTVTGWPAVSPDGQYLLSTRSDQGNNGSDESAAGIQLYQLTPAGPRLLWTRLPRHWGSNEARWTGLHTLLLKQDHEAADQEAAAPADTYVQLELPR